MGALLRAGAPDLAIRWSSKGQAGARIEDMPMICLNSELALSASLSFFGGCFCFLLSLSLSLSHSVSLSLSCNIKGLSSQGHETASQRIRRWDMCSTYAGAASVFGLYRHVLATVGGQAFKV